MLGVFEEPPTLKQMAQMCSAMCIMPLPKIQELNDKYDVRSKRFIEEMFSDLMEEEIAAMCKAQFKLYDRLEQISRGFSKSLRVVIT